MDKISLLDCTLRDGGYINDFAFGKQTIASVVSGLADAGIEIVECGFLKSGADDADKSLFGSVEAIVPYLPKKRNGRTMFVAMIAYGDISAEEISDCGGAVEGIRLTFHEKELDEALAFAACLKGKGYKVFFQPVGTTTYTDGALLRLIEKVNALRPFAFYLVDTLGAMYKNDLLRMFYLVDNNLRADVRIGFHSHNNLQLSFSNAQELILMHSKREIIIDTSVYGMGRGAGNLCTELLTQYINENIESKYDLLPVLECIDEYIMPIFLRHPWGYSVPYYLAAVNGCHPNYATYLVNRQTLRVRDINSVIKSIPSIKSRSTTKNSSVRCIRNTSRIGWTTGRRCNRSRTSARGGACSFSRREKASLPAAKKSRRLFGIATPLYSESTISPCPATAATGCLSAT